MSSDSLGPRGDSDLDSQSSLGPRGEENLSDSDGGEVDGTSDCSLGPRGEETNSSLPAVLCKFPSRRPATASALATSAGAVSSSLVQIQSGLPASESAVATFEKVLTAPSHSAVIDHVLPLLRCSNIAEEILAQALSRERELVKPIPGLAIDDLFDYVIGPTPRPIVPSTAQSDTLGIPETFFRRNLVSNYAVVDLVSIWLHNAAAGRLGELIQNGTLVPISAAESSANDETSLVINGSGDNQGQTRFGQRYEKVVGRIMGVFMRWVFTVSRPGRDENIKFLFLVPSRIYNMDCNTGETTYESLNRCRALYGSITRLLKRFRHHRGFNNDRAGQNQRTYNQSVLDVSEATPNLRVACDCHDVQTAQSCQLDAAPLLISNVLHVGLQFKQINCLQTVRHACRLCIRARLRKVVGVPPPSAFSSTALLRRGILDLYLDDCQGPSARRRKLILERMCNGPWNERRIYHYCVSGCCETVETLDFLKIKWSKL